MTSMQHNVSFLFNWSTVGLNFPSPRLVAVPYSQFNLLIVLCKNNFAMVLTKPKISTSCSENNYKFKKTI